MVYRHALTLFFLLPLVAAADGPRRESPLNAVFEENFRELAQTRFRMMKSGQYDQDLVAGRVTLHPGVHWVRPAFGGFTAEYSFALAFPEIKDRDATEAEFGFVLASHRIASARFVRERTGNAITGKLLLTQLVAMPGGYQSETLREYPLPADADGGWTIRFHHGLLVVRHGDRELGRGFLGIDSTPVIGVTWNQHRGSLTCSGMTLAAIPVKPHSPTEQADLRTASQLNATGLKLLAEGKVADAVRPTEEASAMFIRIHGELHHDAANSLTNLALLATRLGNLDKADGMLRRALATRRVLLGGDHPHVAQVLRTLGELALQKGQSEEARRLLTESLKINEAVYPAGHPAIVTLNKLLTSSAAR